MVKVPLERENVKCFLQKHIGVVSILGGKDNLVLFGSNGKLSGESGLSDMLIVEGDGLLDPVYVRVVLCQPRHPKNYLDSSQPNNHEG